MKQTIGILAVTALVALFPLLSQGQSCTPCPKPSPVQYSSYTETYKTITVDGCAIDLKWDVYCPTTNCTGGPWPAVVVLHAGGFVTGSKNDPGVQRACVDLAAAGFLALAVNYRLAGDTLPAWQCPDPCPDESCHEALSPSRPERQVDDVMAAIRAARNGLTTRTQNHVTGWVGAVGGSAGGGHALYCSTPTAQDKLDCAVLLSGAYDFADSLDNVQFANGVHNYCDSNSINFLRHESPINLADPNTTGPLVFFAAETCETGCQPLACCPDTMPIEQFENLQGKLTGFQSFRLTSGGGHAFDYWNVTIPGMTTTVGSYAISFLQDHLP